MKERHLFKVVTMTPRGTKFTYKGWFHNLHEAIQHYNGQALVDGIRFNDPLLKETRVIEVKELRAKAKLFNA